LAAAASTSLAVASAGSASRSVRTLGYQVVPPFGDWVNDVLGSLGIGE
jgi:hypothetical protein